MSELILLDYECNEFHTGVDLENLDDILRIDIEVLSGDEIARIIYKNGDMKEFDSNKERTMDFEDNEYCIYQEGVKNEIDDWLKRGNSYDYKF